MDFRNASVVVDESKLRRAVSAHLSAAMLALNATEEDDVNVSVIGVDVEVDGETESFNFICTLTGEGGISGVILERAILNEDDESLNQLVQVFVQFPEMKATPLQQVATMMETYAVRNRAVTTQKGIELLLD